MDLENDVYLQMSQCASALEFSSSTWNKELSPSQVGLLARESTVYNAVDESFDYECISAEMDEASQTYKWTPDLGVIQGVGVANAKFSNVVGNQYGSRPGFDNSIRVGEQSHIELIEAMKSRITPETYKRARRTHGTFCANHIHNAEPDQAPIPHKTRVVGVNLYVSLDYIVYTVCIIVTNLLMIIYRLVKSPSRQCPQ